MRLPAFAATIVLAASFASSAFAGDTAFAPSLQQSAPAIFQLTAASTPLAQKPRRQCRAGQVIDRECLKYGPTPPGKLFGGCIEYALKCVTPIKIN